MCNTGSLGYRVHFSFFTRRGGTPTQRTQQDKYDGCKKHFGLFTLKSMSAYRRCVKRKERNSQNPKQDLAVLTV
jgi:hypothetical protein